VNFRLSTGQQTALAGLNESLALAESLNDYAPDFARWKDYLSVPGNTPEKLLREDRKYAQYQATVGHLRLGLAFSRSESGGSSLTDNEISVINAAVPHGKESALQFTTKIRVLQGRLKRKIDGISGLSRLRPGQDDVGAYLAKEREGLRQELREGWEPETPESPVLSPGPVGVPGGTRKQRTTPQGAPGGTETWSGEQPFAGQGESPPAESEQPKAPSAPRVKRFWRIE